LRLGATPSPSTVIVPRAARFRDAYPGIDVVVEVRGSRDLIPLLAQGELDLALIILPLHRRDPALATVPIQREPSWSPPPPPRRSAPRRCALATCNIIASSCSDQLL